MPTVFANLRGYRLFFFSIDRREPMHIHVANSADTLNSGCVR
jgi:hypothetical protein